MEKKGRPADCLPSKYKTESSLPILRQETTNDLPVCLSSLSSRQESGVEVNNRWGTQRWGSD